MGQNVVRLYGGLMRRPGCQSGSEGLCSQGLIGNGEDAERDVSRGDQGDHRDSRPG